MKKILALLMATVLILALAAGCSGQSDESPALENPPEIDEIDPGDDDPVEPADDGADTLSPAERMIEEIKADLETQLAPLPELQGGEKIGVLIISLTNPFWVTMKECYEEAGRDLGVEVEVITGTTEGDTTSQLEALMTMATKDYDAIIVSPIEGSNLIPGIIQCNQNGIPVINLGPGVDTEALESAGGYLDAKITVMFEEQGSMVANDMISRLPDGGQVAILQGLSGAAQSEGRSAGARAVFEAAEGIDLVAEQPCDWDATLAFDATKDLLVAYPELKGIFACNDVQALAVMEALKSEGRDDVLVYGVDFTDDAKASIEAGEMMGSMTYSSAVYTRAGLLLALKIIQEHEVDGPVYSPLSLVTQDNVSDFDGWR